MPQGVFVAVVEEWNEGQPATVACVCAPSCLAITVVRCAAPCPCRTQMLSYEPHDLRHVLGSLKERTLEKLGSLGRTLGALRGPTHGSGPQAGVDEGEPSALWATHGSAVDVDGHAGVAGGPGPGAGAGGWGQQAAGASGSGALGAAGSGQGGGGHVAVGAVLARSLTRAAASAADWWQHLVGGDGGEAWGEGVPDVARGNVLREGVGLGGGVEGRGASAGVVAGGG